MVSFVTALAIFGIAGNAVSYFTIPASVNIGVKQFVNLKEGGFVFPDYMSPPFNGRSEFHIFAIKNPREVLRGEKIQVSLKGPFYYNYKLERSNIGFSRSGQIVSYRTRRVMSLDETTSQDLDEKFWQVNPILPGVLGQVKQIVLDRVPFRRLAEPIVFNSINVALDTYKERLFVRRSARQLLEGKLIELLDTVMAIADRFGLKSLVPPGPPDNVFGIAYAQNATYQNLEIWVGVGETREKFGDVNKWQGKDKMSVWDGRCNIINGTNGELYKPDLQPGKALKVFLPDLCRTFYMDPVGSEPKEVQNGLMALEYELTQRLYLGARTNPRNKCFCKDPKTYDCQYDGLISIGPCFFDAPLFFSRGNMRGVSRPIRSLIDESSVEVNLPEKQSFYIDRVTGAVLKANLTLMALVKYVRQPYMRDLANVQNLTYAPFFATTEIVEVPNSVTMPLKGLQLLLAYHKPANLLLVMSSCAILALRFTVFRKKTTNSGASQVSPSAVTATSPPAT